MLPEDGCVARGRGIGIRVVPIRDSSEVMLPSLY